jgi:hypothetical protein
MFFKCDVFFKCFITIGRKDASEVQLLQRTKQRF